MTIKIKTCYNTYTETKQKAMNEAQFKAAYISQFLASYMAGRYERDCQEGHIGKPYDHQPIEDASFLANKAWEQLQKHTQDLRTIPENLFKFQSK